MIYLDNAATTYPKPECVYQALDEANHNMAFNAGRGTYSEASRVADMIMQARESVASLVGTTGETVSFESSATEALNIIINGLDLHSGDTVYISPFEHNAVVRPLYYLKERRNINIQILPFNKATWEVDEQRMNDMFVINKPKACFITHISNVTGFILPYGAIFAQTKKYNCINILDCSQSLGVLNPDTKATDFIVFAGHKSLYASFGIGGFINLNGNWLEVSKSGGTGSDSLNVKMPESGYTRYESGSINSVAVAGLYKSIGWLKDQNVYEHEAALTRYLLTELKKIDKVKTYIPIDGNIFGTVSINVEGYSANDVGTILADEYDICVRTGYHCSPFVHEFIGSLDSYGTVRISLGAFTKYLEIDELLNALITL